MTFAMDTLNNGKTLMPFGSLQGALDGHNAFKGELYFWLKIESIRKTLKKAASSS